MNKWKIISRGYVLAAEKQTEHFEVYISKNEQETFFWLRIYQNYRILSEYISAADINEACALADAKIASYIEEQIKLMNLLKKELG